MTMTLSGMTQQVDEALRRAEIDALLVTLSAALTPSDVALALVGFVNFPRVTAATTERLAALTPPPKSRKSRAK